jgi:hypothetical protein
MDNEKPILRVRKNSVSGQKLITIPKKSSINAGDYVVIQKVNLVKKVDA